MVIGESDAGKEAMPRSEELRLIARAKRGSADAFRALVDEYKDRLFAFVWRMIRDHHEAEDICQSSFVRAYEALDSYSESYAFSTWLYTIAYRLCVNQLRKRRALSGEVDFSRMGTGEAEAPDTVANTEEARRFGIGVSSPADMVLLLEKLARGEMVNKAVSDQIIGIMKNQMDKSQAARLLPFAEDTTLWIANKTGSLDDRKIDVGLVSSAKGTYVYAIFCDNSADLGEQPDNKATLAVAKISRLLYDYFMK